MLCIFQPSHLPVPSFPPALRRKNSSPAPLQAPPLGEPTPPLRASGTLCASFWKSGAGRARRANAVGFLHTWDRNSIAGPVPAGGRFLDPGE
jgi:hypothetical protein